MISYFKSYEVYVKFPPCTQGGFFYYNKKFNY